MNRVIYGVLVLLVVLFGAWYFMGRPVPPADEIPGNGMLASTTPNAQPARTNGSTTHAPVQGGSTSFKSIFANSGNYECKYSQVHDSVQNNSVIYIADGKMRGEFRTIGGTVTADIMIYTGGYLYTWKEGATTGKKTSIKSVADLPQVIPQDLTSGAVYGSNLESVGWDCHSWVKDTSLLTVPSYVTFR